MSQSITISKDTIDLIKNLSAITNSICFKPGKRIRVMNVAETLFGDVHIPEEFPVEFSIAEVNKLIAVFNLPPMRESEIKLQFDDSHLLIKGGRSTIRYRYTDRSFATPPDLEFTIDNIDFACDIDADDMSDFLKTSASLGLKLVEFVVEDGKLKISATDPELGEESNDYVLELGDNVAEFEDGRYGILREYLNLYRGGYRVVIDGGGLAEFRSIEEDIDLVYHIGVEMAI